MYKFLGLIALVFTSQFLVAQTHQPSSSEILLKLRKLNYLGSVLYVAAHPDDENTRAIAYLANDRLAATAYLSMTRGDGGQNLIGPEIRDLLGLIRTQELLAARKIDGGEQFFTRAVDFGFSKNYQETFSIWNKDEILSDVVKVIRQYQPDVILTRFPPDERAGHGHHTASAMLAQEAFDLTNNPSVYPDQVAEFGTWQVKRLFTNTGRWWNNTINEKTPGVVTMNVGSYNALLGESYSEMAAESRTQHKSQGFGSPGRRGDAPEYFEFVKGEKAEKDILENINTTWTRLKGGERVEPIVQRAIAEFNSEKPYLSITRLLEIRKEINGLEKSVWKERKLHDVNQLIQDCLGLFLEVGATQSSAAPGESVQLSFEVVNRSQAGVQLKAIRSTVASYDSTLNLTLSPNQLVTFKSKKRVLGDADFSAPYWLRYPHSTGLFEVRDKKLIGQPENRPAVSFRFEFLVGSEPLAIEVPLINKWTDPVKGELWRPFEITPPISLSVNSSVFVFAETKEQPVTVLVKSYSDSPLKATVKLDIPKGWRTEPASALVELTKRGEERSVSFQVFPSIEEYTGNIKAVADVNGKSYDRQVQLISYDHIPTQTLLPEAAARVLRLNIVRTGNVIGYIKGAGDDVPAALRNLGYEVWEMKNEEVTAENLKKVDAVVLGVRALNTNERIRYFMPDLLNYVAAGGALVVQYNTNFDLEIDADKFSPFPLKLSRDRVTEENSAVTILDPSHPLMSQPNVITAKDFDGWVQERGLYFPGEWDANFQPLLSMKDGAEPERKGSLLVANYGKGVYVYTGLSFFRELPEGVPGAYKLFANLVSAGKRPQPTPQKVKASKK
jgi:LmbE family N-acetylglucosaminyl deacetylase